MSEPNYWKNLNFFSKSRPQWEIKIFLLNIYEIIWYISLMKNIANSFWIFEQLAFKTKLKTFYFRFLRLGFFFEK
ncbi:unnamed protein product [Blepharisma stoltei]|uniref:Uncharacterized protein n=1 Tax=Blepharisma stoltei TaxID=1481888 RepID=A0AAU9J5B0_9CILI|nr:unnamed protein product [Blepharisma stoltei]